MVYWYGMVWYTGKVWYTGMVWYGILVWYGKAEIARQWARAEKKKETV